MSEYQRYPDPEPRGRHARDRASESSAQQGRPEAPRDASRRASSPMNAGQPVERGPVPRQQPHADQQSVSRQRARVNAGQQPVSPAGRGQSAPMGAVAPAAGRSGQQPGAYRSVQRGAYRPVQPASGAVAPRTAAGKGGKGKKGGPWRVVFWAALVVLVGSLVALGVIGYSYWQGQQSYQEIAQEGFTPPNDLEGTSLADMTVDWDALRAINPDTVGWIYIPGTVVNYPVVHTSDNEKYLTHDFKGSQGWIATFGAIFLDAANKGDFTDANNFVYGHHLNDGSMFACIADFEDATQFNDHRTVYLLTPQGNYKLSTFSLVHCAADDQLVVAEFASEDERVAYVQDKIDRSVVSASDIPAAADMAQTFAFATCDNLPTDGRWVLFASVAESTVASGGAMADPNAVAAVDEAAQATVDEVAADAAQTAEATAAADEAAV